MSEYEDSTIIDEDQFRRNFSKFMNSEDNNSKVSACVATQKSSSRIHCPVCTKNHTKKQCPALKKAKGQNKKDSPQQETPDNEEIPLNAAVATSDLKDEDTWFIDSGCTSPFAASDRDFVSMKGTSGKSINGVGGRVPIEGKGKATKGKYSLQDVSYASGLPCNLMSVSQMTKNSGKAVVFTADDADAATSPLYSIPTKVDIWHSRLGNPGPNIYRTLSQTSINTRHINLLKYVCRKYYVELSYERNRLFL